MNIQDFRLLHRLSDNIEESFDRDIPIQEICLDDTPYVVYIHEGEVIAFVNKNDYEKFSYNIHCGTRAINEIFESMGVDKVVHILDL